ncbi:hypothetical protein GGR57DRAFT_498994 [Xylariaceae sp. FL1272]|nr:hypothetical protein GGR57DRAFT_498994 [Xylariaceae sp. FL1272]
MPPLRNSPGSFCRVSWPPPRLFIAYSSSSVSSWSSVSRPCFKNNDANNAEREDDDVEWEKNGDEADVDEEDDEYLFDRMTIRIVVLDVLGLIYRKEEFLHFLDPWFAMCLTSWAIVVNAFWYIFAVITCTVVTTLVVLLVHNIMGM